MSLFAKAVEWLKGPVTAGAPEAAVATAERESLRLRTAEVQQRITGKVTQAQTHLSAADTVYARYDTMVTRAEQAVTDARGEINARGAADPAMEVHYRTDGLRADPRVPKTTKNSLLELGGEVGGVMRHARTATTFDHVEQARKLLNDAESTASRHRDLDLDTSELHTARAEQERLQKMPNDLYHRARAAYADIYGQIAIIKTNLPGGLAIFTRAGDKPY